MEHLILNSLVVSKLIGNIPAIHREGLESGVGKLVRWHEVVYVALGDRLGADVEQFEGYFVAGD